MTASRHHAGLSTVDSQSRRPGFPEPNCYVGARLRERGAEAPEATSSLLAPLVGPDAARLGAGTLALASARWVRVPGQARQARPQPAAGRASGDAAQRRGLPAPDRF